MAEAYAQGRLGLPPARGHAAATEKRCVAQERATCPDCAAVSSNKALLTVCSGCTVTLNAIASYRSAALNVINP